jgi:predicted membrane-bound mannosyltransferase
MQIFRTCTFTATDIVFFKWSCTLFGMLYGAWLYKFTRRHATKLLALALLLAIKPALRYWGRMPASLPNCPS